MNSFDPLQPPELPSPNQPTVGQPGQFQQQTFQTQLQSSHQPTTRPALPPPPPLSPYQPTTGQFNLPPPPPPSPYQPMTGQLNQPPPPFQAPAAQSTQQLEETRPLRERYKQEQIDYYFNPLRDHSRRINELQQECAWLQQELVQLQPKLQKLIQRRLIWAITSTSLFFLFLVFASARNGVLAFLTIASSIGGFVYVYQLSTKSLKELRDKLQWLQITLRARQEELSREIDQDRANKELTRRVNPPTERQYDDWLDELGQEVFDKAPFALHLRKGSKARAQAEVSDGLMPFLMEEPRGYRSALYVEEEVILPPVAEGQPPLQYQKKTSGKNLRQFHNTLYMFTAFYITEDHIAVYTNTIDLLNPTIDLEEFEYGHHEHLSHLLLSVNTEPFIPDISGLEKTVVKRGTLKLTFNSGHNIERRISTLHVEGRSVNTIDDIHKELIVALRDHLRSREESIREARNHRS